MSKVAGFNPYASNFSFQKFRHVRLLKVIFCKLLFKLFWVYLLMNENNLLVNEKFSLVFLNFFFVLGRKYFSEVVKKLKILYIFLLY
jgi:hypothetical protein